MAGQMFYKNNPIKLVSTVNVEDLIKSFVPSLG